MKDKISIIIPYYNSSPFLLRKCLNSCFAQNYDNVQVILLNDGSPHDISGIVNEFQQNYDNFVYSASSENHGVSYQRNKGIDMADGEYLLFIDSDDYIDPDMAKTMYERIICDKSDLCICGVDGAIYSSYDGLYDRKVILSMPEMFDQVQYTNFAANKMFKSDIVKKYAIKFSENIKLGEDAVFCQDYYKHVAYVSFTDRKFYHYIIKDTSSTRGYDPDYCAYEKKVIQKICDNFSTYALCARQRCFLEKWVLDKYAGIIEYYLANNASVNKISAVIRKVKGSDIFQDCYKNMGKNSFINKDTAKYYRSIFHLSYFKLRARNTRNHVRAALAL